MFDRVRLWIDDLWVAVNVSGCTIAISISEPDRHPTKDHAGARARLAE
jgi:hypothetical protein